MTNASSTRSFPGSNVSSDAPIQITGSDAVTLAARGVARTRFPELAFEDHYAEVLLSRIDLDPTRFPPHRLRAAVMKTKLFDHATRTFFERHPDALGIGFFSGVCTRFSRVDNGRLRWVDVETPAVAQLVAEAQPMNARHVVTACCSIACTAWMRRLEAHGPAPALIVIEGGFVGAPRGAIEAFFLAASRSCGAGVEILADFDGRAPLRARPSGALEVLTDEGAWARFPRVRFVRDGLYAHLRIQR